jgi:hypothetical protein
MAVCVDTGGIALRVGKARLTAARVNSPRSLEMVGDVRRRSLLEERPDPDYNRDCCKGKVYADCPQIKKKLGAMWICR